MSKKTQQNMVLVLAYEDNSVSFTNRPNAEKLVNRQRAAWKGKSSKVIRMIVPNQLGCTTSGTAAPMSRTAHYLAVRKCSGIAAATALYVRRKRESEAPGAHSESEWQELVAKFDNKCLRCGISGTDTVLGFLTRDHIEPLSQGGSNFIGNIQPLCGGCNSWKSARFMDFRSATKAQGCYTCQNQY